MSNLPRSVSDPRTGETITFLKTTEETQGEYLLFRTDLPPNNGIFSHYHTEFVETFEGVGGDLELTLSGRRMILAKGEKQMIPLNKIHRFTNKTDQFVSFNVEIRPAGTFEKFVRASYGLDTDHRSFYVPILNQSVPKNILLLGTLFEFGEFYLPYIPRFVQRAIFGTMAKLAKWCGAAKTLEKYYT
ncbi:cupin domain-containing protein [Brevibacillus ginsengisoli]|uniref:cupin domain-containing protein n=1 Tax=Brevibacillus ginsengisoli TaxID=363854 RepID=UPI003CF9E4D6